METFVKILIKVFKRQHIYIVYPNEKISGSRPTWQKNGFYLVKSWPSFRQNRHKSDKKSTIFKILQHAVLSFFHNMTQFNNA